MKWFFAFLITGLCIYYFYPESKFPNGKTIDRIEVYKSKYKLLVYSQGTLLKTYAISLGSSPIGQKQYEGDGKTPEGIYTINDKNPYSVCYKNLGISYPNNADTRRARALGRPAGGEIKIHGLKNGRGFIGKFHRWHNWTNGCIGLTDQEVDELYNHTPVGTVIAIYP